MQRHKRQARRLPQAAAQAAFKQNRKLQPGPSLRRRLRRQVPRPHKLKRLQHHRPQAPPLLRPRRPPPRRLHPWRRHRQKRPPHRRLLPWRRRRQSGCGFGSGIAGCSGGCQCGGFTGCFARGFSGQIRSGCGAGCDGSIITGSVQCLIAGGQPRRFASGHASSLPVSFAGCIGSGFAGGKCCSISGTS